MNIKQFIHRFYGDGNYSLHCYNKSGDFLSSIKDHYYDLAFIDIILDEKDGIQVGEILNELSPSTDIVFISGHPDYFQDVYKARHSWFLTKPMEWNRFEDALKRISLHREQRKVTIQTKKGTERIAASDILYLESNLKHTIIHMFDGTSIEYSTLMQNIEQQISNITFVRIHKSFIVNVRYIIKYNSRYVELVGGHKLNIGRTYYSAARERLTQILAGDNG